jgi:hypothetical protein
MSLTCQNFAHVVGQKSSDTLNSASPRSPKILQDPPRQDARPWFIHGNQKDLAERDARLGELNVPIAKPRTLPAASVSGQPDILMCGIVHCCLELSNEAARTVGGAGLRSFIPLHQTMLLGIHNSDSRHVHDFAHFSAILKDMNTFLSPDQNRAHGFCLTQSLQELVGDIA